MQSESLHEARVIAEKWASLEQTVPDRLQPENLDAVRRSGMLTWPLPATLGGRGCSPAETTQIVDTVAQVSPSMALLVSMPLGLAGMHAADASAVPERWRAPWEERVDTFAADVREGVWYAACNSERGAGGSLDATKTTATRTDDGNWTITGEKILATAGSQADRFFSTAKVRPEELPGAGTVEFFYVRTDAPGVTVLDDWDGFGMRPTESQTVRYESAPVEGLMGFPDFLATMQPVSYWYCLFAAIPLGCAESILDHLATPMPQSAALRSRFADAQMRIEAMRAYLAETVGLWRPAAGESFSARVLRTKTFVTQEATRLCAELFALAGGRHYRRTDSVARALADSFAGTALRPPLALGIEQLAENFSLDPSDGLD